MAERLSIQEILSRRHSDTFVGRREHLDRFRQNLQLQVTDERRRFLINVHGQAGMGKTYLLEKFRHIARDYDSISALVDDTDSGLVSVLNRLAHQLGSKDFRPLIEKIAVYDRRRHEIANDPDAPAGLAAALGYTLGKSGTLLARRIPVAGVAFDFVDSDAIAQTSADVAAYVAQKATSRDEEELLSDPARVLTPLFLKGVERLASRFRTILLCFDSWDQVGIYAERWLISIMGSDRYGLLPVEILVLVSGQKPLNRVRWGHFEPLIMRMPVDPFTDIEFDEYLASKSITDPSTVHAIRVASKRVPLLVATMTAIGAPEPGEINAQSTELFDRVFKTLSTSDQRRTVLELGLARLINKDVITALAINQDSDEVLEWLTTLPFIVEKAHGWQCHEIVRVHILRYARRHSPSRWQEVHTRLREFYANRTNTIHNDDPASPYARFDAVRQAEVERAYHGLCAGITTARAEAVEGYLLALETSSSTASEWIRMVREAAEDSDRAEVRTLADALPNPEGTTTDPSRTDDDDWLTRLLLKSDFMSERGKAAAHAIRGRAAIARGEYGAALRDVDAAVTLAPGIARYRQLRGATLLAEERVSEALKDFDASIELAQDPIRARRLSVFTSLIRGDEVAHRNLRDLASDGVFGRDEFHLLSAFASYLDDDYQAALDHVNSLTGFAPSRTATVFRSRILTALERYDEAFSELSEMPEDMDEATKLERELAWVDVAIAAGDLPAALRLSNTMVGRYPDAARVREQRGLLHLAVHRPDLAVIDLDAALEQDPGRLSALKFRGAARSELSDYTGALDDLSLALRLEPASAGLWALRGEVHRSAQRWTHAENDLRHALELEPASSTALLCFGMLALEERHFENAKTYFNRVITADPTIAAAWGGRAVALANLGDTEAAVSDADQAVALEENEASSYLSRSEVYRRANRLDEALSDAEQAVRLAGHEHRSYAVRALVWIEVRRLSDALVDLRHAVELAPNNPRYYVQLARVYSILGFATETKLAAEKAFNLVPESTDIMRVYADALADAGLLEDALAMLDQVAARNRRAGQESLVLRGLILSYMRRYQDAIGKYRQSLRYDAESMSAFYNIAVAKVRWQGLKRAGHELGAARVALARFGRKEPRWSVLYAHAGLAAVSGERERALERLGAAIESSTEPLRWMRRDIAWDDLRAEPEFCALGETANVGGAASLKI
jgi:tetratricopeptide (TPR) repeat protein